MICVLKIVFQSFISMQMICEFICLGIGRIWMGWMISALNEDLDTIFRWSAENELLLNLCKSQSNSVVKDWSSMVVFVLIVKVCSK
jgi:hypothetical protein